MCVYVYNQILKRKKESTTDAARKNRPIENAITIFKT